MDTPQIMEENGKRYRMLQVGETIEDSDQACYAGQWQAFVRYLEGVSVVRPAEGGYYPQGYYRRLIQ